VGRVSIGELTGPLLPFFAAMVAALLLVSTFPGLTLWLPQDVLGLIR
jgi:TRAP-type C4-dicarboxylate transport system permease large subunit